MLLIFFQSLMASSDYHLNILLAFENRDENQLLVVPPDKLEELKRRFVTVLFQNRPAHVQQQHR